MESEMNASHKRIKMQGKDCNTAFFAQLKHAYCVISLAKS